MPSSVTPPSDDNVASLFLSDTFYTWFNVSNDMVNKVNPIEVYSITADTANYLTGSQKDGILITDNGNGNYNIGLDLPANITGGITWHGDHVFNAGISGHIVNTINGLTGARQAVQTISGRTAEFSGGTGNVPSAVFSINGVTATATGGMTLEAADISGVATTGGIGTILAATGGGAGPYSKRVELFTTTPEEDQTAIRIKGTTGDLAQVGFGTSSLTSSCRIHVAQGGNSNGIRMVNDVDIGPDIYMTARGHIQADNEMKFLTGFSTSASTHPFDFKVGDGSGQTHGAMDSIFRMRADGIDLNNKVYAQGSAAGAAGKVLKSTGADLAEWVSLITVGTKNDKDMSTMAVGELRQYDQAVNTDHNDVTTGGDSAPPVGTSMAFTNSSGHTILYHINNNSRHSSSDNESGGTGLAKSGTDTGNFTLSLAASTGNARLSGWAFRLS